ncbi:MAG: 2-oxo-4-hydroxy-4-carboxy-5-ureidoimidazoline decarboxylase [Leptolyngbyaceae bacterium]|nr:2-oxo-4-hydroxy-4-carboxy-5-ureidoimidazoline decarboxylase [Leptolyngbyaceae bacterium]
MVTLSELNQMDQAAFTDVLGAVFEETPAIAHAAWSHRPFVSVEQLHQVMVDIVRSLPPSDQLALIRAHPDLGSRAKMADASVEEQASVGLNQLTPQEYDEIQSLNHAYKERFEMPFIIAVKQQTKASIFDAFRKRLTHTPEEEVNRAIDEIAAIAKFRLDGLIQPTE